MPHSTLYVRLLNPVAAFAAVVAISGCATPKVDAQWSDPQASGTPLAGSRVLLVCEAAELVISRLCTDRLTADLQQRGATVVIPSDAALASAAGQRDDTRYVTLARATGAVSVWATSVGPDMPDEHRSGGGVSIGLGGFSFGRGGGVGVGVSVPVGGGSAGPRYGADARVIDTASGRLLWTARAGAPPSGDARSQLDNLLPRLVGAAADARLF